MSWPPPSNRIYGLYRCRGHWHLGLLWLHCEDNAWELEECATAATLELAWSKWWLLLRERRN